MSEIFEPIGYIRRGERYRFEAPRQGIFSGGKAFVGMTDTAFWREACRDLDGFERLWLVGIFHLNRDQKIKPLVHPPVAPEKRGYGVFATRSPHRPNPIALSCVRLCSVQNDGFAVDECDLLDGTPILDIKPYIPAADSFPAAACGWRSLVPEERFTVTFAGNAAEKAVFLLEKGGFDLCNFARVQLEHDPLNSRRKRVKHIAGNEWLLAWRTWRLRFRMDEEGARVEIVDITSGYRPEELRSGCEDIYGDKSLHRLFNCKFC